MRSLTSGDLEEEFEDSNEQYEMIAVFEAQFPGHCTLNWDHKIKVRDRVARVQHADNPMLPVPGVACTKCMRDLEFAKR